jgi:hypothetical protein
MSTEHTVPAPTRDEILAQTLIDWVAMWNSYDLDQVARLFVADDLSPISPPRRPALSRASTA